MNRDLAEFKKSDFGKKCEEWLVPDLIENGPLLYSTLGQGHFLPDSVTVTDWLSSIPGVLAHSDLNANDKYCEAEKRAPDSRTRRRSPKDSLPEFMRLEKQVEGLSLSDRKRSSRDEGCITDPSDGQIRTKDVALAVNKPFFVGEVDFRKSPLGFSGTYVVSNVWSVQDRNYVPDIPLSRVPPNVQKGEFVVGFNSAKGPFLFANQKWNSAVQILMWESFKESQQEPSAETYFSKNPTGLLTANFVTILGSEECPGHVIIKDKEEKCLKGFSSIGQGRIRYFNVEKFSGDFLQQVALVNQVTEIVNYKGNTFAILVPELGNDYAKDNKHAVIDCEGWVPCRMNHSLVSLDLSKFDQVAEPTETKAGLVNESDEQDSELKTRGTSDIAILSESQKTLEAEPDDEGAAQIKTLSPFSSPAGKNRFYCGSGEDDFLRAFIEDLQECGYDYKTQDIVRFHTCIKNGGFTLLGGISGCGKSTLVSLYARALLGKRLPNQDGVRFLAIDVNPAWSEPSDILGYWNLHEQYSCAPSGLVSFLRDSIKSNEVRLICLEEMNLARTEHYLSDFIQLMSRDQKDRVLLGVPLDVCGIRTDAKLPISETIRFVGTNNFDETTQRFSPRFYDRCNYIELQETGRSDEFPRFIPSVERGKFDYGVNYEMYEKWRGHDVRVDRLDKQVVTRFKDIVAKLLPLCLLPSPRVKQAILEYVLARPFFPGCGSDYHAEADCQLIALDESIAQRVLARYSVNYLRNEKAARDSLLEELKKDMPLSYALFLNKCNPGERPARV